MAVINLDDSSSGNYGGLDVNRLKEYSDKYIYIVLGMDSFNDTPSDILVVENYTDLKAELAKRNFLKDIDYANLLWVKPIDPMDVPDKLEPENYVWVMSDIIYTEVFKKCTTIEKAVKHIEHLVNRDEVYPYEINDFIILVGKEIAWPKDITVNGFTLYA